MQEKNLAAASSPATVTAPTVSVVVATRDRRDRLAALLDALAAQTFDVGAFEVIVVDDGSHDGTADLLAERERSGTLSLRSFRQDVSSGPAAARNRGWRAARADLVAFTDDDCEPVPHWLDVMLATARDAPRAIVQGMTQPNPREASQLGPFTRTLEVGALSPHFPTCNILYPRAALTALGGFDEQYGAPAGEDTDLGWRARAAGYEAVFAPAALVHHAVHQRGPMNILRDAFRATDCVKPYRDHPGLRVHLANGLFFHPSHPLLAQAVLAAALIPSTPFAAVFAAPYLVHLVRRCRQSHSRIYSAPFFAARDAVEVVATLRGALRHRTAVL